MATLTIEDVPDELLKRLREQANSRRKSLSQQALHVLQTGMSYEQDVSDERDMQVQQWKRLAGCWKSDAPPEKLIRDLYAARSAGREVRLRE
ncbi:MAG: hypothetical protein BRD46_00885 [Bacteroidetes bacterium QS_8_68_15]|nr:MAG: hypothetical protein BRD46_00885 [Bacteroidetes bacterium QS_8_68_15]